VRRDERGSALVEFTWLAILLMVPLVYLVLSVFEVQRGAYAVSAAARSAARAYSLADSDAAGREAAAAAAAVRVALMDQGLEGQQVDLDISCTPDQARYLQPGSTIRVLIETHVDLPLLTESSFGAPRSARRADDWLLEVEELRLADVELVHLLPLGLQLGRRLVALAPRGPRPRT